MNALLEHHFRLQTVALSAVTMVTAMEFLMNHPKRSVAEPERPSREEIEQLCLLHVIGERCPKDELASRLGLSPALSATILNSVTSLIMKAWVWDGGEALELTESGAAWLEARLASYGISNA